ncbi:MAG: hypothetical protein QM775_19880 [Pirellulales bacterium]
MLNSDGTRVYVGAGPQPAARLQKLLTPARLGVFDKSRDIRVAVHVHDAAWTELLAVAQFVAERSRAPLNWLPGTDVDTLAATKGKSRAGSPRSARSRRPDELSYEFRR